MKKLQIAAVLILLFGCGENGSEEMGSGMEYDTLCIADTIGVLLGDSCYEFGEINDVQCFSEGIAVADGVFSRIAVYSSSGEFTGHYGGRGEGPGEFTMPVVLRRFPGGNWFVYDFGTRSYTILDSTMAYIHSYSARLDLPFHLEVVSDSTAVVQKVVMDMEGEVIKAGYRISLMNAFTGEDMVVYREHMEELGGEEIDLTPFYDLFTVDSEGNVYLASIDADRYAVEVLSMDGTHIRTIELPEEDRVSWNSELHTIPFYPFQMPLSADQGTTLLKTSHPGLHPYITGMTFDQENNLWIRRMGLADSEYWDVVSPEGVIGRSVVLYADTTGGVSSYPRLYLNRCGMAATMNEMEVERFYTVDWKE